MVSKFSVNLSKIFSLVSMVVSDFLSYHISKKLMPLLNSEPSDELDGND